MKVSAETSPDYLATGERVKALRLCVNAVKALLRIHLAAYNDF